MRPGLAPLAMPLFIIVMAGCESGLGEARSEGQGTGGGEAAILVRLGRFERGSISDRLEVAADIEAIVKADVPPEIPGVIREVLRREGDRVAKGDPVVQLVDEHLRLAVENRRILAAQAGTKVKQADLARREGAELAKQRQLLLDKARSEFDRVKKLVEDPKYGLVSSEELDVKRYAFEQAQIDHRTCLLLGEKYQLEYEQAVESRKLAEVEQRTAEYNLSQATLRAPIDGQITYLLVKPGEMLATSTRAFSVVDTSRLEARLHVPQRELARVRPGLPVRILCEVFREKEFDGVVEVVNPVVEKANGTVGLIVGVQDREGFLRPGMFISGEVIVGTHADAILLTKKAVSYENQEPIVFLVKGTTSHRFVLKPGFSTKSHIEVLALTGMDGQVLGPAELGATTDWALVEVGHNNLKEGSRVEIEGSMADIAGRATSPASGAGN